MAKKAKELKTKEYKYAKELDAFLNLEPIFAHIYNAQMVLVRTKGVSSPEAYAEFKGQPEKALNFLRDNVAVLTKIFRPGKIKNPAFRAACGQ